MNLRLFISKMLMNRMLMMLVMFVWLGSSCLSLHGEVRQVIDARQMLNEESNIGNCLSRSLEKGNYALIKSIISVYDQQHEALIIRIFEKQLQRLKILQQQIILEETQLGPVIKWGQNETHLFISIKMSHRWDSPPCLNTKHQSHSITNTSFEYINICVVSHSKITFSLKINFYDDVSDQDINIQNGGVGIYSTIVEKRQFRVWPFLDKQENSYQKWLQISERYNSVEKQYEVLLDDILRSRRSKPVVLDPLQAPLQTTNDENTTAKLQNETIVSSQNVPQAQL